MSDENAVVRVYDYTYNECSYELQRIGDPPGRLVLKKSEGSSGFDGLIDDWNSLLEQVDILFRWQITVGGILTDNKDDPAIAVEKIKKTLGPGWHF